MAIQAIAIIPVMASLYEVIYALGKKGALTTNHPSEPRALHHIPRSLECRIPLQLSRWRHAEARRPS
jgi:hypothetical protein